MLTPIKDGNKVKIEGILSEVDLAPKSFTNKSGQKVDAIGGTIKIRVNMLINKSDAAPTELEVPVQMFASKYKNDGNPNPAYESIERVMKEFVSIAAAPNGIDGADRVRITNASIQMNEYYNQSNQLVSFPRISASFITKIRKEDCKPEASFTTIFVVGQKMEETDKDGVATGRYIIKGMVPQYGGKVDVVTFHASNPGVIDAVSTYWNEGDTVKAAGKLNFSSRTEEKEISQGFGDSYVETRTISVSELIITGGNPNPLEGEFAYNEEDISTALAERKENLAKLKDKKPATAPAPTKSKYADLGF